MNASLSVHAVKAQSDRDEPFKLSSVFRTCSSDPGIRKGAAPGCRTEVQQEQALIHDVNEEIKIERESENESAKCLSIKQPR